jgi:hypothetical protein
MRPRILLVCCAALALTVGVATATAGGGNSANAKLCQKGGWQTLVRSDGSSFANQDECVSYAAKGGTLSSARLVWTTEIFDCSQIFETCWGHLVGSGLAPNAEIEIHFSNPNPTSFVTLADASGNVESMGGVFICGANITGVYATSTLPSGATITSNTVDTPCG